MPAKTRAEQPTSTSPEHQDPTPIAQCLAGTLALLIAREHANGKG